MEGDNPDGAGIAWIEEGSCFYLRGLNAKQIFDLQRTLPRPFFLHFRYATRGGKSMNLTHPFPLGDAAFTAGLAGSSELGVLMHNGTWHGYEKHIPEHINPERVSDTQVAAYVIPFVGHDILDDVSWATAVMFQKDGEWNINYRGTWVSHKGNRYSNLNWQTRNRRYVVPVVAPSTAVHAQTRSQARAYEKWWAKNDYPEWNRRRNADVDLWDKLVELETSDGLPDTWLEPEMAAIESYLRGIDGDK